MMRIYDVVQWAIVLGIVLISALYMLGRIAPQWRVQLAQHLQQPRYAHWVNQLGMRIGGGSGCGACDSCGTCATPQPKRK
ncbi:MAG: hypothetical protein QM709_14235 [Spongiibacteraceae bacterium]